MTSTAVLFVGACSIASAADILLVGDPALSSTAGVLTFLNSEGHDVTQEVRKDGPGNANSFDLVIMASGVWRDDYNGDLAGDGNAVTAPVLSLSAYLSTTFGWGWVSGSGVLSAESALVTPFPEPEHPFLFGLEDPVEFFFTIEEQNLLSLYSEDVLPEGVEVVAFGDDGASLGLFTIEAGTLLADADNTPAGGLRVNWPMSALSNPFGGFNDNGRQIMRNIIETVTAVELEPIMITKTAIEAASGDLLVTFFPAGPDHILKVSSDLESPFEEVPTAVLDVENSTFRVPAATLDPSQSFFVVESTF